MEAIFRHFTGHSFDIDELFELFERVVQIESGGLTLCTKGSCDIVIDIEQYHISQWDMAVVLPLSVVQIVQCSDDFEFVMIGANISFFMELQLPNKGSLFTTIRENPSISLNEEEANKILSLHDKLLAEQQNTTHPFRAEIDDAILRIISYEVAAIFQNRKPITKQPNTRSETIFYSFVSQLLNDTQNERSLQYYAQKQQITTSHLSKCVKEVSGRSALKWIQSRIINNIQMSLQNQALSISDICEEYNFPNSSFFTQYYKKYTGITPREYRARLTATQSTPFQDR